MYPATVIVTCDDLGVRLHKSLMILTGDRWLVGALWSERENRFEGKEENDRQPGPGGQGYQPGHKN